MDPFLFVADVLQPLASGGALTVRAPIDQDDLEVLLESRSAMPGVAELAETRRSAIAGLLIDPPPPSLDEDSIKLGVAVHNLCWLLNRDHPDQLHGAVARVAIFTANVADLMPPSDAHAVCARHSLVHRLRSLQRRDVVVRFWAGQRAFRGEAPPKRLLSWEGVRRVRSEHSTVALFDEAVRIPTLMHVVESLLGSSPLTDVLGIDRAEPHVDLRNVARWLRVPSIARVVADEYLRRGLGPIAAPLCTALLALCNQKAASDETTTAILFHSHVHLLDVLSRPPRDREGHVQAIRGHVQGRERAAIDAFAVYAASDRVGLGRPYDLDDDFELARNVEAYVEACAELVGEARVVELTGVVARGAGAHARVSRVMMKGTHASD